MQQKHFILILLLMVFILSPVTDNMILADTHADFYAESAAQGLQCPGALPSRMRLNQPGKVVARNGTNLREAPSRSARLMGGLPEDATFTVIGGPVCADGFTWWEVRYQGRIGWTAESGGTDYWLESLAPAIESLALSNVSLELEGRVARNGTVERKTRFPIRTNAGVSFATLEHIRFSLELNEGDSGGLANISVFQTALFSPVIDGLDDLAALLETRPTYLDPFSIPQTLPAVDMQRVLISSPAYVNFNGGTGLRFIGHFSYQPGFVPPDEIYYVYLGLSDDSAYYVQGFIPIRANVLPDQMPENFNSTPYTGYMLGVQTTLDNAPPDSFTPTLGALDDLMRNIVIRVDATVETVAARFEAVRFTVDRRLASGAQGEDIEAADPFTASLPLPRHVQFTLNGVPQINDGNDNPVPHIAVFPADSYNFLFVGAVDAVRNIIDSGNPTPEITELLPVINRKRRIAAAVRYVDFIDGRGVRFLAHFSPQADYITSSGIVYVYIGLTNDNESLVQVVIPVEADVLPDVAPADLDVEEFLETYDAYLQDVERFLNNAEPWQFTPRLDSLDALVQSIRTD